jgi:metallophosphoesterase (TIGR03768 family)
MRQIRAGWSVALAGVLLACAGGCSGGDGIAAPPQRLPIDPVVLTTRQQVVLADPSPWVTPSIQPSDLASYPAAGYGTWRYGPGVDAGRRLDLMPPGYTGAQVAAAARLATFFTFSDTHLTDEESPAGAVNFGYLGGNSSAYSGVMLYTTQVLDAAVQTVNAIHRERPIDFGLHLGDAVDNTQGNELRWYLEVMDGRVVSPDSGVKDDPIPGPGNDHQDPFQAAGFDPPIPWWQVRGNHDDLWKGSAPVSAKVRAAIVGAQIMNIGPKTAATVGLENTGFYVGVMDGRSPYGAVFGAGPEADFAGPPTVPADPERRSLTRADWMSAFLGSTSIPAGHDFTAAAVAADTASYTFEPMAGLPLEVIVLDDTQLASDFEPDGQGSIDPDRLAWLLARLQAGSNSQSTLSRSSRCPAPSTRATRALSRPSRRASEASTSSPGSAAMRWSGLSVGLPASCIW